MTAPRTAVRRFALARFISITGSMAAYTALMFVIYDETGSAVWLAASPTKPEPRGAKAAPDSAPQGPARGTRVHEEPHGYLTDETLAHLRQHYRGWDFHALHAEFKAWIRSAEERMPERYQSAFIGFVRRYHEKNRHQLAGF